MYSSEFQYDPNRLEEYMKAGRRERALAFGQMLTSVKEMFSKKTQDADLSATARPGAAGAC